MLYKICLIRKWIRFEVMLLEGEMKGEEIIDDFGIGVFMRILKNRFFD